MTSDINHNNIILNIQHNIGPDHWEFAWTKLADEMKKSIVSRILKTSFHTNISLENVKDICRQLINNYENTIIALKNHHSPHPNGVNPDTNLCLSNFLRDIMEINDKTMIIMKEYLDECKCCEEHIENCQYSCLCICKKMSMCLKSALSNECPLQVKGKLWQRKNK